MRSKVPVPLSYKVSEEGAGTPAGRRAVGDLRVQVEKNHQVVVAQVTKRRTGPTPSLFTAIVKIFGARFLLVLELQNCCMFHHWHETSAMQIKAVLEPREPPSCAGLAVMVLLIPVNGALASANGKRLQVPRCKTTKTTGYQTTQRSVQRASTRLLEAHTPGKLSFPAASGADSRARAVDHLKKTAYLSAPRHLHLNCCAPFLAMVSGEERILEVPIRRRRSTPTLVLRRPRTGPAPANRSVRAPTSAGRRACRQPGATSAFSRVPRRPHRSGCSGRRREVVRELRVLGDMLKPREAASQFGARGGAGVQAGVIQNATLATHPVYGSLDTIATPRLDLLPALRPTWRSCQAGDMTEMREGWLIWGLSV
uniref:Uncharacterized protein n=1 Tax=Macrostomum lignano TaxID=282301 RepID=A0A1I8JRS3_9PLAT